MERTGEVTAVRGGMLEITFCRPADCEKCNACHGGSKQTTLTLKGQAALGDLAVVDITMPRMDGITFTQTLREGNCDLPVLMVTARVTQEDKRRGFRAGTGDYMVKPVDEEEIL